MMAYDNKFVVSILVNGKPVRELNVKGKRTATVQFGSEYVIRIKNKNRERAMANVSIDGTDVLCGKRLILGPNEKVDLERFVDEHDGGSKFKFISLEQGEITGEIQDPDSAENGRIVVEFQKEKVSQPVFFLGDPNPHEYFVKGLSRGPKKLKSSLTIQANNLDTTMYGAATNCVADSTFTSSTIGYDTSSGLNIPESMKGATVEGSHSDQKFEEGESFPLEHQTTTLEIYLKGPALPKSKEYEWGVFVGNERSPRAKHVSRPELMKIMSSMVLPDDKEIKIEKVY